MTAAPGPQQPDKPTDWLLEIAVRGPSPEVREMINEITASPSAQPDEVETRVEYLCLGHPAWPGNLTMSSPERAQGWLDDHRDGGHPIYVVKRTTIREPFRPAAPSAQPDDCGHPNHGGAGHDCSRFLPAPPPPLSQQRHHEVQGGETVAVAGPDAHGPWCNGYLIGACDCAVRCTCPEDEAGRLATYTCQRGTEPHAGDCPRWGTPAQPVRDTGEGRR